MRHATRRSVDPPGAPGAVRFGLVLGVACLALGGVLHALTQDIRLGPVGFESAGLLWIGGFAIGSAILFAWSGTRGQAAAARRLAVAVDGREPARVLVVGPRSARLLAEFASSVTAPEVQWVSADAAASRHATGWDLIVVQATDGRRAAAGLPDVETLARLLAPAGRVVIAELFDARRHEAALLAAGLVVDARRAPPWRVRLAIKLALELDLVVAHKPTADAGRSERSSARATGT